MKKIFLLLALILVSCTSKLDFDQANELKITPVFEGDMFFFDISKNNLIDSQSQFRSTIQDTIDFAIFKNGNNRDHFVKAEFTIGYNNSFQRSFHTEYVFIDENNQPVEQNSFDIQAADINQNVEGEEIVIYSKAANPDFINFRKIVVKITVTPDTMPVEDELLHIKTKGKIYTEVVIK
jgi:uncharacterized protein YrzB (UPF0473 family)